MGSDLPFLVWVDCEMTGLNTERDALVEIAVLITDAQLNVIGEGVDKVIRCDQTKLDGMNEVVRSMHQESGLLLEIPNGCTLDEADQAIYEYLTKYEVTPGKSPLAGNSVYMDRMFISRDLPKLNSFLHYRTIDVSTIKELARRWYPKTYFAAPAKEGNHRALGDIRDSIDELDYYRSTIFQKAP
jgi:oligoribonuclease